MAVYQTLLQIIQSAQRELGLPVASTVIGNSDQTTIQMYAFANQELDELRQRHLWTVLQNEYNLVVSPPVETTGDVALNSAVISNIPSTAALLANYMTVAGPSIPAAARILSVDSPTQITMSMEATAATATADLTFSRDTYPEPSDFDSFIGNTWWDRTNRWSLLGPDSPQVDQWHRSGIVTFGPRRHFRQLGSFASSITGGVVTQVNYRIWPPPAEITEPLQLVFEYLSFNCVYVNGNPAVRSFQFANDADVPILNSRAIIMGIKWRFWSQKGFDWTGMRTDYDNYVDRLASRDGGADKLQLARGYQSVLINSYQVQDGYFPGPGNP